MNIEELRKALASDATEKVKELEAKIERLNRTITKQNESLETRADMLRVMFNRCAVLSGGALCLWCGYSDYCDKLRSTGRKDG